MRSIVLTGVAGLALVAFATLAAKRSGDFYATRPPFERPFPAQRVPEGLTTLSAAECGACHTEIYREWQQSVHAQAWADPQFQAELHKDPGVSWMCVNCHTPLRNQLDSLVVALVDDDVARPVKRANPDFDPELKLEAITCASCHVRDGAVEGPFRDVDAPHAVRYNPEFRSTKQCEQCHQAVQAYPGKNFICTFQTGDEWRAGPYAEEKVCQDCHMPEVQRPMAIGSRMRRTGTHSWTGSRLRKGTETEPALWDSLAGLIEPGVELRPAVTPAAKPGTRATWTVRAANANAGHQLPTGDPERAVIVELAAVGHRGDTLATSSLRIAQQYEWYPEVRKVSDNRLAPNETVTIELHYEVPRGGYRLVARAVNERISDASADYHALPASYPRRTEVARVEREVRP